MNVSPQFRKSKIQHTSASSSNLDVEGARTGLAKPQALDDSWSDTAHESKRHRISFEIRVTGGRERCAVSDQEWSKAWSFGDNARTEDEI